MGAKIIAAEVERRAMGRENVLLNANRVHEEG
jgi:hypothetical protein